MASATHAPLFSPAFFTDPYPTYNHLREHGAVQRATLPDGETVWVVTRYEDVVSVLKDDRFVKDFHNAFDAEYVEQIPLEVQESMPGGRNMLVSDPPKHTRLRSLVSQAFTPRVVEALRPRIQTIADELLDAVQAQPTFDLIDAYAFPLPINVICEMLGVPVGDQAQFRHWSNTLVSNLGSLHMDATRREAVGAFIAYIRDLVAQRRRQPTDDLISGLVQAEEQGDKLDGPELISMILLLLVAGHETTVNLIGNGTLPLLQHPDQLRQVQGDPALIKPAVEELLRYGNPVQTTFRWAGEDLTLAEQPLKRGERVMVVLAAADHDKQQFADAERLDVTRERNRHVAFGQGIHFCLGAPLARLEGQIAIGTLLRRFPDLRLAVAPHTLAWRPGFVLRGLFHLPVQHG